MEWNYFGIDNDPPSGKLLILTDGGQITYGTKHHPDAIAWINPQRNEVKEKCGRVMGGLPELKMIGCIFKDIDLVLELCIAMKHYEHSKDLGALVDLVRTLDRRAHAGTHCIPNYHR